MYLKKMALPFVFVFLAFDANAIEDIKLVNALSETMQKLGYTKLDASGKSLEKLTGADQVWYDEKSGRNIVAVVKDGNTGFPLNSIEKIEGGEKPTYGYAFEHQQTKKEVGLAFYDGFSKAEVEKIAIALEKTKVDMAAGPKLEGTVDVDCNCTLGDTNAGKIPIPLDISSAEIFGSQVPSQPTDQLFGNEARQNAQMAFGCMKDVVQGVWDSTGGQVVGAAETVGNMSVQKAWETGHKVFKGVRDFVANFQEELAGIVGGMDKLLEMDRSLIASIMCSMIGEIGGQMLVSMLTGGLGAFPAAILKLKSYMSKLSKTSKFLKAIGHFAEMTEEARKSAQGTLKKIFKASDESITKFSEVTEPFNKLHLNSLTAEAAECILQ